MEMETYQDMTATDPQEAQDASFATIAAIYDDGVTLKFDGMDTPTEKRYQTNAFVVFKVGDRVRVIKDSGTYVVEYPVGAPRKSFSADYATNAGTLGGLDASAYPTSIIKSVTFSAATADGYVWTGIPFPKYVIGVDLEHLDVIVQFYKGSNEATARAEWAMMFFSRRDVTTPLNGSFNGRIYYIG